MKGALEGFASLAEDRAMYRVLLAILAVVVTVALSERAAQAETKFNFTTAKGTVPDKYHKKEVRYSTSEPRGTIVVDTRRKYLYLVLGDGMALRYGIGVGRDGFKWKGTERITRKAKWPSWTPPPEMLARSPNLPKFIPGGEKNPLGARALYLGSTLYRIHGTLERWSIGRAMSSGCIRMLNEHVIDLYDRVRVGTRVVVH